MPRLLRHPQFSGFFAFLLPSWGQDQQGCVMGTCTGSLFVPQTACFGKGEELMALWARGGNWSCTSLYPKIQSFVVLLQTCRHWCKIHPCYACRTWFSPWHEGTAQAELSSVLPGQSSGWWNTHCAILTHHNRARSVHPGLKKKKKKKKSLSLWRRYIMSWIDFPSMWSAPLASQYCSVELCALGAVLLMIPDSKSQPWLSLKEKNNGTYKLLVDNSWY